MSTQSAEFQPRASSQAELLAELAQLAAPLQELPASQLDETAAVRVALELTHALQRTLNIVTELERLDSVEERLDPVDQTAAMNERDWEPETWVGIRNAAPAPPRLGDVCFACGFELNIALRALTDARHYDTRLPAIESGRRKLYRAIHAVARVAAGSQPLQLRESLDERANDELQSSLAVRRLYAEFRHNLRRAADDSSEAVLTALRYAASALATLTASPHYGAVRVSDATLLRHQHERLLDWSRAGKPRAAGLQLLEDISTCASLLHDINRRQELRNHDGDLIRTLLSSPALDHAAWLTSLDRLLGLDDTLDNLTVQLRTSQHADVLAEIRARLQQLG